MPPDIGDTGTVKITRISPTGNARVELSDEKHLNIGYIDCSLGDSVRVERLDEKYCKSLDQTIRGNNYLERLSKMREHDNDVEYKSEKSKNIKNSFNSTSEKSKSIKNPFNNGVGNKNNLINGSL